MNSQLARNLVSTARLVVSNVIDDPSYFALQVARKFKNNVSVKTLDRVLGLGKGSNLARSFSAMLRDDKVALKTSSQAWLSEPGNGRGAVFLANLCIASGEWETAEKLLHHPTPSASTVRARARLAWALGDMSEALRILTEIKSGRQAKHYASEATIYRGQEPNLSLTKYAEPFGDTNQTVVFLATNSLPHTGSGYAQRTQSILAALENQGWKVKAATRVNYPLNIGQINAKLTDVVGSVEYERLIPSTAKHDLAGRIQQQAEELLTKVLRDRPSILHTTTDFSNALAVKAVAEATGLPWIYEVRGQLADTWLSTRPSTAAESERYQLFIDREAFVAKHADHVITLGSQMKSNLTEMGVAPSKISILPNAVGDEFLKEPTGLEESRQRLGLEQDAFYVGTVSSLVAYEGLETVLEAVAILSPKHPHLRALIVGDGTDRENLIRLSIQLGISDRCDFPGRVPREQAHLYHSSMNVFVVPRVDSSVTRAVTPLKPVEALASGVPVVASDLPALRELIIEGENGHLVPPENAQAWAKTIQSVLVDSASAQRLGRSGRNFVLSTRTWEMNAKKLVKIYDRVINQASGK